MEAAIDLQYLLNRGYPRDASTQLVATRHRLDRAETSLLKRCVHEDPYNESVRSRLTGFGGISLLIVDFYYTVSLVREASSGHPLYECTDAVLRDNARGEGRSWKRPEHARMAISLTARLLKEGGFSGRVLLVADAQVPHSAVAMRESLEALEEHGYAAEGLLARRADTALVERASSQEDAAVLTGDRVVLERVGRVAVLGRLPPGWKVVRLGMLIERAKRRVWCPE